MAGVKVGHIHPCQVAGHTVIQYGRWRSVALWWVANKSYRRRLTFYLWLVLINSDSSKCRFLKVQPLCTDLSVAWQADWNCHFWYYKTNTAETTTAHTFLRSKTAQPKYKMESHTASQHRWTCPALTPAMQASTWSNYPGGIDGWVDLGVGYIPRWFTRLQMVTHPSTNQARRWLTSLMRPTTLPTTSNCQPIQN